MVLKKLYYQANGISEPPKRRSESSSSMEPEAVIKHVLHIMECLDAVGCCMHVIVCWQAVEDSQDVLWVDSGDEEAM